MAQLRGAGATSFDEANANAPGYGYFAGFGGVLGPSCSPSESEPGSAHGKPNVVAARGGGA
ncbi:MAG: hypothetical protein U0794_22640 [Isosphaeraceae bacterium]